MGKMPVGVHFTGTIGNICYYEVGDRTFVRIKSSLTRKRVLKDKKFASTRKHAGDLGKAAQLASPVYRALPSDIKGRWIFRAITGEIASLLYAGKTEQQAKDIVWAKYIENTGAGNEEAIRLGCTNFFRSTKTANQLLRDLFKARWEAQGKPDQYFKRAWRKGEAFKPENVPRMEYFLGLKRYAG
jgi:hypothetical protein